MADNVAITPGAGATVAADDIGGVLYQRVKPVFGVDGSATDVSASNPLPVTGPLTDAELRATAVPVSGPLTDAQLRATAVPVSDGGGSITVDGSVTANPTRKTLAFTTGTVSTSGDNTIIAAPGAGQQIYVRSLQIQNESSTATTVIVKFGATAKWRVLLQNQGDGLVLFFPPGTEWQVGDNVALVLNLSGANSIGYSLATYTEA